jgi:hypothetical protein
MKRLNTYPAHIDERIYEDVLRTTELDNRSINSCRRVQEKCEPPMYVNSHNRENPAPHYNVLLGGEVLGFLYMF